MLGLRLWLWLVVFGLGLVQMWTWTGDTACIDGGGRGKGYVNRTR